MATLHFILQGKGGVGKSMIASLLYQYLDAKGLTVIGIDTDPVNHTLASYRDFNVQTLDVMQDGKIDSRKWDLLLEGICEAPDDAHVLIDNGASSFVELTAYMKEMDMINAMNALGHDVIVHTLITGGQALKDTNDNLVRLCMFMPETPLVVWLNPFFGEIEMDGKKFEEFKSFREFSDHFRAVLRLPTGNRDTLGKDLEELFAKRMPFKTALDKTSQVHRAVKMRLTIFWRKFVDLVDIAGLAPSPEKDA